MPLGEVREIYPENSSRVLSTKHVSSYTTDVIASVDDFDRLEEEWKSLVDKTDVTVFQTYEWLKTWWSHFGGQGQLHIITVRHDRQLVGIMPMFIDTYRVFGIPVYRCLRMIGSLVMQPKGGSFPVVLAFSDYLDMIAMPEHESKIIECIGLHFKLNQERKIFDEVILEEIPEDSAMYPDIIKQMSGENWICEVTEASECPVLTLPETWEEYLQSQSRNSRYKIRACLRKVEPGAEFNYSTCLSKNEITEAFDKLVRFHQQRWNNLGQSGIFADPRILAFIKEITFQFSDKNWLWVEKLSADNQTVAVDLMYVFKDRIYLIQRGFDDSSPVINQGPGNILLYHIFRSGIKRKMKMYDFLRGMEDYKLRLTSQTIRNKTIIARGADTEHLFRKMVYANIHRIVHLKRKLRNEHEVIHVHLYKKPRIKGLVQYLGVTCTRLLKRL